MFYDSESICGNIISDPVNVMGAVSHVMAPKYSLPTCSFHNRLVHLCKCIHSVLPKLNGWSILFCCQQISDSIQAFKTPYVDVQV